MAQKYPCPHGYLDTFIGIAGETAQTETAGENVEWNIGDNSGNIKNRGGTIFVIYCKVCNTQF